MNKEDINKVREDIKSYEHHKKIKHLSTFGVLGGLATAGVAGYKNNKTLAAAGGLGAFGSGFIKGRAKKKEQAALNRIKNFYDLRKLKVDENGHEKVAILLEAVDALIAAGTHFAGHDWSMTQELVRQVGHTGSQAIVTLGDVLTIPYLAHAASESTKGSAFVAAKDILGKPLTGSERFTRGLSGLARSAQVGAEGLKKGPIKSVAKYLTGLAGPLGSGGHIGEIAGGALKQVEKISPRYAELGLGAIRNQAGVEALKTVAKADYETFKQVGSILDSVQDEIPFMRRFLNSTGTSIGGTTKKILENPESAVQMAQGLKDTVIKSVRSGKYLVGAAALAGLGVMAGSYRGKHPLFTNELPKKILDKQKEEGSNLLPFRQF